MTRNQVDRSPSRARRPGARAVDAGAGDAHARGRAAAANALEQDRLDPAAPLAVAVAVGHADPAQRPHLRVALLQVAGAQRGGPGVDRVADRTVPVVLARDQVGHVAGRGPAAVAAGVLGEDRRAVVGAHHASRGPDRVAGGRGLQGDGAATAAVHARAAEHLALRGVADVVRRARWDPAALVGAVAAGRDGLRLEGGRLPGRRRLARHDAEQVVLEPHDGEGLQRRRAGPDGLHGAAVVPRGAVREGEPHEGRTGEAQRTAVRRGGGLGRGARVRVRRPARAGQRGQVQTTAVDGGAPARRAARQRCRPAGREVGDRESARAVDLGVLALIGLQQHPDGGLGQHRARGARVVGGGDGVGVDALARGALGAPLRHATPVAPAVALDREDAIGWARVDLVGQRRGGDRHGGQQAADQAEQGQAGRSRAGGKRSAHRVVSGDPLAYLSKRRQPSPAAEATSL